MVEVLSIHIPKTAGTAFWEILTQVYRSDQIYRDLDGQACEPNDPQLLKIKLLHSHYPLSKYLPYFPDAKKIVWLRHPIFRVISDYFFSQSFNDRNNPLHVQVVDQNLSLLEYAQLTEARNVMTAFTAELPLTEFYFVGIQEFFTEDLLELKRCLGWPKFHPVIENTNPNPNYFQQLRQIVLNPDLMAKIADLNAQDMVLYETALAMRAERLQQSLLLQVTLAEWDRLRQIVPDLSTPLARSTFSSRSSVR
ncbi:MAG: sulfotransferase family protein [Elainella sp. Prado103]|jgi:hypothetical protein|nr:sulfotransferase family protein [Elainella sp. Prado103]